MLNPIRDILTHIITIIPRFLTERAREKSLTKKDSRPDKHSVSMLIEIFYALIDDDKINI